MSIALIVLAAGKGTRMNSDLPKVLHPVAGEALLVHAIASGAALAPAHTVVVAGHGAEAVRTAVAAHDPEAQVVLQTEQLGTAHAVAQAAGRWPVSTATRWCFMVTHPSSAPRRSSGWPRRARGTISSCWGSRPPIRAATDAS